MLSTPGIAIPRASSSAGEAGAVILWAVPAADSASFGMEIPGAVPIQITRGQVAWVSPEDVDLVSKCRWRAQRGPQDKTYYASRGTPVLTASGYEALSMHRLIMDAPPGVPVDHADRNGLNNTRSNLRLCTVSLNCANKIQRIGASNFRGVRRKADRDTWEARIQVKGQRIFLGHFIAREEAARAYDAAARYYFGEFARLNFPGSEQERSAHD